MCLSVMMYFIDKLCQYGNVPSCNESSFPKIDMLISELEEKNCLKETT